MLPRNEAEVGRAILKSGISRERVTIVTKVMIIDIKVMTYLYTTCIQHLLLRFSSLQIISLYI